MRTSEQLAESLAQAGVPRSSIAFFDSQYVLPEPRWVTGKLGPALDRFLFDSGLAYAPEQFDCNKFAKAASAVADWSWARTEKRRAALAFGIFCYWSDRGGHAVNVAVHAAPGTDVLVPAWYEPQPSGGGSPSIPRLCLQPLKLSEDDLASCFCCLFS